MKIFNWKQADIFIKYGCTPIGIGLGNKNKTYVEFKDNEKLKNMMKRWMAKEF